MANRQACPTCGKRIAVYVPKGGDGSRVVLQPHTTTSGGGLRCENRDLLVPETAR